MTTQTTDDQTAGQHTNPLRPIVAFTLLGVVGAQLLAVLLDWLLSSDAGSFIERSALLLSGGLIDLITVGLPVLAVLIATHVAPMVKPAKPITLVALIQLGVVALLALIGLVTGAIERVDQLSPRIAVLFLLDAAVKFGLLGIAIFVVLRVFLGAFAKPAATPAFGGYAQQQFTGQPYPQQAYGQPQTAPTPQAAATATAAAAQAGYAQQGGQTYGAQSGYQQQAAQEQAYQQQLAQHQAQQQYAYQQQAQAQQQAQQAQAQQAQYQSGYQTTAPTSAAPASSPPSSAPPASSYAQGQATELVQPTSGQPAQQQQTGWPPSPMSTAQWPPTPAAKPAAQEASGEDVQHTQVIKPEGFRGNAGG